MKKALIIGASGYLGNYLFKGIISYKIFGTYLNNYRENLFKLDLNDEKKTHDFIDSINPDVIIYAAGLTNVDQCEKEKSAAFHLNAEILKNICLKNRSKIIYFSTDYVFDGEVGNYVEKDIPNPINIYGHSKVLGERLVLSSSQKNVVIRVSGLYNTEFFDTVYSTSADDDRISSPVSIEDVCSALQIILDNDLGGIFHIGGPHQISRYEFLQMHLFCENLEIKQNLVPKVNSEYVAARPKNTSLNTKKISKYGWSAKSVIENLNIENKIKNTPCNVCVDDKYSFDTTKVKAIFIDCIGGILTERSWQNRSNKVEIVDSICGKVNSEKEFAEYLKAHHIRKEEISPLINDVVLKYTLNKPIWNKLFEWKKIYKLALVNNGFHITFRKWVRLYDLDCLFDILCNSSELGMSKYDPMFFLNTAKALNVKPEECLLIDDDDRCLTTAQLCGVKTLKTISQKKFPLCDYNF